MTDSEILDFLIKTLEGNNARKFAEKTGITPPILSRIRKGELRLSKRYDAIMAAYPMLNREFLTTGEGYPGDLSIELVRERMQTLLAEKDRVINTLTRELELNQKVITRLTSTRK